MLQPFVMTVRTGDFRTRQIPGGRYAHRIDVHRGRKNANLLTRVEN